MVSESSLILARYVDDKVVAESAKSLSKVKNDKCGGAVADGVDLESYCGQLISFPAGVILILQQVFVNRKSIKWICL